MLIFNLVVQTIFIVISVIFDILSFNKISGSVQYNKDKIFLFLFSVVLICINIINDIFFDKFSLFTTICEILGLYIYFGIIKKENKKLVLGSAMIFSLVDLIFMVCERLVNSIFVIFDSDSQVYLWDIIFNILALLILYKYSKNFRIYLTDINSSIFLGIIIYLYVSIELVNYYLNCDQRPVEVIQISLGLLVLQTFFAILVYAGVARTQKNLLTRQEQERQRLQFELIKAKKENIDAKNRELALKDHQLQVEIAQLKEYSN